MKEKDVHRGEIWFVELGDNKGSVQSNKRPALIISNEMSNLHSDILMVIPITSKNKIELPTHVPIKLKYESLILCEQITTISKKCLCNCVRELNDDEMKMVENAIKISLEL